MNEHTKEFLMGLLLIATFILTIDSTNGQDMIDTFILNYEKGK